MNIDICFYISILHSLSLSLCLHFDAAYAAYPGTAVDDRYPKSSHVSFAAGHGSSLRCYYRVFCWNEGRNYTDDLDPSREACHDGPAPG